MYTMKSVSLNSVKKNLHTHRLVAGCQATLLSSCSCKEGRKNEIRRRHTIKCAILKVAAVKQVSHKAGVSQESRSAVSRKPVI